MKRTSKYLFLGFHVGAVALTRPSLADDEVKPGIWTLRAAYSNLNSEHYDGWESFVEGDANYAGRDHLLVGAYGLSRSYADGTGLTDVAAGVGEVASFGDSSYVEARATYASHPKVLPDWSVSASPHQVFSDASDLSLEMKYNSYFTGPVISINPGWSKPVGASWTVGAKTYVTHTYHWILAEQGSVDYAFTERSALRVTGAFGRTLEQPGLEDAFRDVGAEFRQHLGARFTLIPKVGFYSSVVRKEFMAGLGLELRL